MWKVQRSSTTHFRMRSFSLNNSERIQANNSDQGRRKVWKSGGGPLCVAMDSTWTSQRNQDATMKLKSELISIKFLFFLIPLPTPSWSVTHKQFYQCVNTKKKLSLGYSLSSFSSYSYFQTSLWLGVEKGLQKLTRFDKN